jgi:hypothetical protein
MAANFEVAEAGEKPRKERVEWEGWRLHEDHAEVFQGRRNIVLDEWLWIRMSHFRTCRWVKQDTVAADYDLST